MIDSNWLKMHGYNEDVEPLMCDSDLYSILETLHSNLTLKGYNSKYNYKKAMKEAKKYLKETFFLHPVKCMDDIKLMKMFDGKYADGYSTAMAMRDRVKEVNPFRIPITFVDDKSPLKGCVVENVLLCDDPEFLSFAPIVFDEIILGRRIGDATGCVYAHEIMHTQINSRKGMIENYLNGEVISIFMELLTSSNIDNSGKLTKFMLNSRMCEFYKSLNELDAIQNSNYFSVENNEDLVQSKYIQSFLIALSMYDRYLKCSLKDRNRMLHKIQRCMDGYKTLEDQLDDYDISYESSKDARLVKRYL